jgi:hypothetical protein
MVFSGKLWNEEFSAWLQAQGYHQSQSDPSIFVKHYPNGDWLKLIFFVDDMLYCGSNDEVEKEFQKAVSHRFHVKFLGPAHWFLQMRIHKHKDQSYTLDQHRYVLNTLQRYDPENKIKKRETPLPTDYIFSLENRPKSENDLQVIRDHYSSIDFRSAVCTLHWLLGYIKSRPDLAVKFYPNPKKNPIFDICEANAIPYSPLAIITDASWQDCPDTGKSTIGYQIFLNGALIEANTTVPTPIAQSSSEAEYLGACCGAMAGAHIRMILNDLLHLGTTNWHRHEQNLAKTPILLMTDNTATVQMAKNGKLTRKTRHVERRFHFVREGQQNGLHTLHWLPSSSMTADIMTKSQAAYKIDPHLPKILWKLPKHMTSDTSQK